jgi:hypothetical protein
MEEEMIETEEATSVAMPAEMVETTGLKGVGRTHTPVDNDQSCVATRRLLEFVRTHKEILTGISHVPPMTGTYLNIPLELLAGVLHMSPDEVLHDRRGDSQ